MFELKHLHPVAQEHAERLLRKIEEERLPYVAYEGYRTPDVQEAYKKARTSKVGAWRSVHQYGCAIDFAIRTESGLTWPDDNERWVPLYRLAETCHFAQPISWDKGHLVLYNWRGQLIHWLKTESFT